MPVPNSYIKSVAFELPKDYKYDHSPHEENDDGFIGRENEANKFVSILMSPKHNKGVYLVAGYRGMGKTSFVNKVVTDYKLKKIHQRYWALRINEYSKGVVKNIAGLNGWWRKLFSSLRHGVLKSGSYYFKNKVQEVNLHISAPDIKEIDILRQITSQLKTVIGNASNTKTQIEGSKKLLIIYGVLAILLTIVCWVLPSYFLDRNDIYPLFNEYYYLVFLLLLPLQFILSFITEFTALEFLKKRSSDPYYKIDRLFKRAYANVSKEQSLGVDISDNKILGRFNLFRNKETHNYPLASSKELEQEIVSLLNDINDIKQKRWWVQRVKYFKKGIVPEIIFVFDELDKVSITPEYSSMYEDLESFEKRNSRSDLNVDENRSRRGVIINILGNLKSFLTQANARFVFIAGREMYDAALADISDRQSLLSSIFSHIFYVDSFLKDSPGRGYEHEMGITDTVERYLIQKLYNNSQNRKVYNLKTYYEEVIIPTNVSDAAKRKALFILQKLIVYLTYRSNGSPKKLSKAFEEFLQVKKSNFHNSSDKHIVIGSRSYKRQDDERVFLFIDYNEQYRIGFINYLFRPFIINKSSYLKTLSDNTLVTTPYVMDHLIKFHPFAFSVNNLEQIPEVISPSSTQAFRNYVKSLVEYLSLNHIRETHVNLFSYKFISKSETELNHITLKFEAESAAFNFTLDESYPVKLYIRRKIKELRSIFLQANVNAENQQVYSISFLNGWLGDLDFFDQQYDDAIVGYSDAIKEITSRKFDELNYRDFSLMINFKLKQGLCFEKMKSYQEAISFYTDAINNTKGFLDYKLNSRNDNSYNTSVVNDLLQVVNQSFIAKAYAQEKMSFAGFSLYKAKHNLNTFLELVYKVNDKISGNHYLTFANYFLNLGNLAYYKNHHINEGEIDVLLEEVPLFNVTYLKNIINKYEFFSNNVEHKASSSFAMLYYLLALICLKRYNSYEEEVEYEYKRHYNDTNSAIKRCSESKIEVYKWRSRFYYSTEKNLPEILHTINKNKCNNRYAKKVLAALLSSIGNCCLQQYATISNNENGNILWFRLLRSQYVSLENLVLLKVLLNKINLTLVLSLYKLSSNAYEEAGTKISQTFQLRKILYVIRPLVNERTNPRTLNVLDRYIVKKLYGLNSDISDVADKKQYQKYLKTLGEYPYKGPIRNIDSTVKKHIDDSLSNHPDDREIWLLRSSIKLSINNKVEDCDRKVVNPYNSIATQYGRIGGLLYEEKRCWMELEEFKNIILRNNNWSIYYHNNNVCMVCFCRCNGSTLNCSLYQPLKLIIEHLFACLSIIRISNTLRTNMMVSNSLIGFVYYKIAQCIESYITNTNRDYIHEQLQQYLSIDYYILNDPCYMYRKAKLHFEKAKSLHNQGKEYEQLINEKVYLEDDFNDNSNHFGIALERMFLYKDDIKNKMDEIAENLSMNNDPNFIHKDEINS